MHLPFTVADYVDFYASEHHASNVGRIFRPGRAVHPNWRHLPVGYHGRAGTVMVSGTPVRRPYGQSRPAGAERRLRPVGRLDFEAELGFVIGVETVTGEPTRSSGSPSTCSACAWSTTGPPATSRPGSRHHLARSWASRSAPRCRPGLCRWPPSNTRGSGRPSRDTALLPYLTESADWGFDIGFEVSLNGHVISRPPYSAMHWSPAQMLAHMTVNGASLRTGDLYASGTVSGPERDQRGCLLELSWGGTEPLTLPDGSTRTWLEDSDELVITAAAAGPDGTRVGLGEARGQILPAQDPTDE